ncbi:hypothetical protein ACWGJX_30930 [Streptomyces sp. NPDC054775]
MSEFSVWLDEYQRIYQRPRSIGSRPCPHCLARALRLVFVVPSPEAESGTAAFWCGSCLRGLIPLRAPVPADAERSVEGTEAVPNYTLVVDTGDAD